MSYTIAALHKTDYSNPTITSISSRSQCFRCDCLKVNVGFSALLSTKSITFQPAIFAETSHLIRRLSTISIENVAASAAVAAAANNPFRYTTTTTTNHVNSSTAAAASSLVWSTRSHRPLPLDITPPPLHPFSRIIIESPLVPSASYEEPAVADATLNEIMDRISPAQQHDCELPAGPRTGEAGDEGIQAAVMIGIRRRKMKKHKLKKLRKKMKFEWGKVRQRRELRKEKAFQAVLIAQIKEAERFSAEAYVTEKLRQANETPIPRYWKGRRLPEFIIREKLAEEALKKQATKKAL